MFNILKAASPPGRLHGPDKAVNRFIAEAAQNPPKKDFARFKESLGLSGEFRR